MIFFVYLDGWRITRDEDEIAGPFKFYDEAVDYAFVRGWAR